MRERERETIFQLRLTAKFSKKNCSLIKKSLETKNVLNKIDSRN